MDTGTRFPTPLLGVTACCRLCLSLLLHNNNVFIVCVQQGDVCDSSDEEWEEHVGRHARAFLGLNEPVAEIALDEGGGI